MLLTFEIVAFVIRMLWANPPTWQATDSVMYLAPDAEPAAIPAGAHGVGP